MANSSLIFTPMQNEVIDPVETQQIISTQGYFYTHINGLTKDQLTRQTKILGKPWENHSITTIATTENPTFIGQTNQLIEAHNECAYSISPPKYLALYCLENDVVGGDFYLINNQKILAQFSPELFTSLLHTLFRCQVASAPPIVTPLIRATDNHYHLIYSALGSQQGQSHYELYQAYDEHSDRLINIINQYLNSPDYQLRHTWSVGDLIIFDNFTFMHGRHAYRGTERQLLHLRLQSHS